MVSRKCGVSNQNKHDTLKFTRVIIQYDDYFKIVLDKIKPYGEIQSKILSKLQCGGLGVLEML